MYLHVYLTYMWPFIFNVSFLLQLNIQADKPVAPKFGEQLKPVTVEEGQKAVIEGMN